MNNGHSTGHFPLERGARQGDPLSACPFILVLETLFIQIRENEEIQGIRIDTQGAEVKISAYADDGNFLVLNTHSLNLIFQTCHTFEQFSSLKLNLEKSEACWIGSARGKQDKPADWNWINLCTDKIRILGVVNSYDTDLADTHNFFSVIGKIKNCLNLWSSRGLSIAGRIQIFKNLALSKAVYISTVKNFPSRFIKILDDIHKDFIWNKLQPKIKHSTLIANKDVDVTSKMISLKITWIRRVTDDTFHTWKIIPSKLFRPIGGISFFHRNLKLSDSCMRVVETFPAFCQELVQLWVIISQEEPKNIDYILNESLWNNSFFTAVGKPVFHQAFLNKNILNVSDLMTESGSFLTWQMAKQKYDLNDGHFIDWLGIINSIPSDWKSQIKLQFSNNTSQYNTATQHYMIPDMSVKAAYSSL